MWLELGNVKLEAESRVLVSVVIWLNGLMAWVSLSIKIGGECAPG